jgi:hypothetical protein
LDWRKKVELFEIIRREYEFGEETISGVARKLGVHRRMVRDAIRRVLLAFFWDWQCPILCRLQ